MLINPEESVCIFISLRLCFFSACTAREIETVRLRRFLSSRVFCDD